MRVKLSDVAIYSTDRIDSNKLNEMNYVGVDNLLQNKQGKCDSEYVPTDGKWIKYKPKDILIGNIRPYLRKIWFSDNVGGTNGDVLVIKNIFEFLNSKYLYYILSSEGFFNYNISYSKGAKMPRGDKNIIMQYEFEIPSIEEQNRIVSILDKFDKYCNDILGGLPAEIKYRQQQYEYYRNKIINMKG